MKIKKLKLKLKDKVLCSLYRPGHFEGVLAVINQFLKRINPAYIFLGEKDYQQLYLIKKLVNKKFKVKVFSCKTVRDLNNVALSSRNNLLQKCDLKKSSFIASQLLSLKIKIKKNFFFKNEIIDLKKKINKIKDIKVEYLEIRNKKNLSKRFNKNNFKIFISYYNKKVRLIDNY